MPEHPNDYYIEELLSWVESVDGLSSKDRHAGIMRINALIAQHDMWLHLKFRRERERDRIRDWAEGERHNASCRAVREPNSTDPCSCGFDEAMADEVDPLPTPRVPVGTPGIRDPENPCHDFVPGQPRGRCCPDGHYLCRECVNMDPIQREDQS